MTACVRNRVWNWDAAGSKCSCPACNHCLKHRPTQKTTLLTQPLRITRMTQRFLPLLFPAVDQPISRVSSPILFDCPRLAKAQAPCRVGISHHPPRFNQPAQPSKQSV